MQNLLCSGSCARNWDIKCSPSNVGSRDLNVGLSLVQSKRVDAVLALCLDPLPSLVCPPLLCGLAAQGLCMPLSSSELPSCDGGCFSWSVISTLGSHSQRLIWKNKMWGKDNSAMKTPLSSASTIKQTKARLSLGPRLHVALSPCLAPDSCGSFRRALL